MEAFRFWSWHGLVIVLDTGDNRVKRLTANDIIGHFLKLKELKNLEDRVAHKENVGWFKKITLSFVEEHFHTANL